MVSYLHRHRQRNSARVAFARQRLERRPAAAADGELEQPRHLVEGLAERVVKRRAEHRVRPDAAREQQLAVAARSEQREEGEANIGLLGLLGRRAPRHQHVSLEVVHADEGLAVLDGQRLGALGAHSQADLETGTDGYRDRVDLGSRAQAGTVERLRHGRRERRLVRVSRDAGHDAAPLLVQGCLRGQRLAEDGAVAADHRNARVIAARLDAEHGERRAARRRERPRASDQESRVTRRPALHRLGKPHVCARRGGATADDGSTATAGGRRTPRKGRDARSPGQRREQHARRRQPRHLQKA